MRQIILILICLIPLYSCKRIAKEAAEEGFEKVVKEMAEIGTEKTLKEIASSNSLFKFFLDKFETGINKEFAEGIVAKNIDDGMQLLSKQFPNSSIILKKNGTIVAKGGSLKNSGAVNEFLNYLLPNQTYIIDDCFRFKTDKLGRLIEAQGDLSKSYNVIQRNTTRNSDIHKRVVETLDGQVGKHDSGHMFANTVGGPNELINQVPLVSKVNRSGGLWRSLETIEEKALKEGKLVKSSRKLLYKKDSMCPYAIEFTTIIDGVKKVTVVANK